MARLSAGLMGERSRNWMKKLKASIHCWSLPRKVWYSRGPPSLGMLLKCTTSPMMASRASFSDANEKGPSEISESPST